MTDNIASRLHRYLDLSIAASVSGTAAGERLNGDSMARVDTGFPRESVAVYDIEGVATAPSALNMTVTWSLPDDALKDLESAGLYSGRKKVKVFRDFEILLMYPGHGKEQLRLYGGYLQRNGSTGIYIDRSLASGVLLGDKYMIVADAGNNLDDGDYARALEFAVRRLSIRKWDNGRVMTVRTPYMAGGVFIPYGDKFSERSSSSGYGLDLDIGGVAEALCRLFNSMDNSWKHLYDANGDNYLHLRYDFSEAPAEEVVMMYYLIPEELEHILKKTGLPALQTNFRADGTFINKLHRPGLIHALVLQSMCVPDPGTYTFVGAADITGSRQVEINTGERAEPAQNISVYIQKSTGRVVVVDRYAVLAIHPHLLTLSRARRHREVSYAVMPVTGVARSGEHLYGLTVDYRPYGPETGKQIITGDIQGTGVQTLLSEADAEILCSAEATAARCCTEGPVLCDAAGYPSPDFLPGRDYGRPHTLKLTESVYGPATSQMLREYNSPETTQELELAKIVFNPYTFTREHALAPPAGYYPDTAGSFPAFVAYSHAPLLPRDVYEDRSGMQRMLRNTVQEFRADFPEYKEVYLTDVLRGAGSGTGRNPMPYRVFLEDAPDEMRVEDNSLGMDPLPGLIKLRLARMLMTVDTKFRDMSCSEAAAYLIDSNIMERLGLPEYTALPDGLQNAALVRFCLSLILTHDSAGPDRYKAAPHYRWAQLTYSNSFMQKYAEMLLHPV